MSDNKVTYQPISIEEYTSLHSYLDAVFKNNTNPSNKEIIKTKQEYWKQWYKHYRRQQRKKYKEVSIRLDRQTFSKLIKTKGDLTVSKFVYEAVYQALGKKATSKESIHILENIDHHLRYLIELLEEYPQTAITDPIIERLEELEIIITQLSKSLYGDH